MSYESLIKPPISKALKSGRVILKPGEEIGWHKTDKREEIIIVLKGCATLQKKDLKDIILCAEQTHYIPSEVEHNVKNNTEKELEYIYVVSLFS